MMTINNIITSDYFRDFYPFHEWIQSHPEWDDKNQFYSTKNNFSQVTKDDKLMLASNIVIGLKEIDKMCGS